MTTLPDGDVPRVAMGPKPDMRKPSEFEPKPEVSILYIGTLRDLRLGNEASGIPSELAALNEQERMEYARSVIDTIVPITDKKHFSCIDGRGRIKNSDGTDPQVRRHQVGGTGLVTEVAMYSDAPIIRRVQVDRDDIGASVNALESEFTRLSGILRSSHLGGCGGVNGTIEDGRSIESNPGIMSGVEAIMNIPCVLEHTNIVFDDTVASEIRARAGDTAEWLVANGWVGDKYVNGVLKDNPFGTEDLFVDHGDHDLHGHKEPAILLVLNIGESRYSPSHITMEERGINPPFIWHIDASFEMAEYMCGGIKNTHNLTSAFIANLAKHTQVCNRLAGPDMPLFIAVIKSGQFVESEVPIIA